MSIQDINKQLDTIEYNIGEFDAGIDKLNVMFQKLEEIIAESQNTKEKYDNNNNNNNNDNNNNKNDTVYSVEEYFININKIYEISEIWKRI